MFIILSTDKLLTIFNFSDVRVNSLYLTIRFVNEVIKF